MDLTFDGAKLSQAPIVTPDGWRYQVSNDEGDHFIRALVAVRVTDPDGNRLQWSIPDRLMTRPDVCQIVADEMRAELTERIERFGTPTEEP